MTTGTTRAGQYRTLAEKLQEDGSEDGGGVTFPPELVQMLDRLEDELRTDSVSEASRTWLGQCGLTEAQMRAQLEAIPAVERTIHLYHCDHRGLPLALVNAEGAVVWSGEYDEWGNLLNEVNPDSLQQLIRLPGQQYDRESGLYYNRHRYYNPRLGRYITQDPIGLVGGWNPYTYPLNPLGNIDPLGLKECTGSARILQGNSRLVGKGGGYNTNPPDLNKYGVTSDSSAIIPSQWGFNDKPSARDKINSISGKLKGNGTQLFSCIRDIVDDSSFRKKKIDPQQKLMNANPRKLILEIPGLENDLGTQDVIITIPDNMNCPSGTQ